MLHTDKDRTQCMRLRGKRINGIDTMIRLVKFVGEKYGHCHSSL